MFVIRIGDGVNLKKCGKTRYHNVTGCGICLVHYTVLQALVLGLRCTVLQ